MTTIETRVLTVRELLGTQRKYLVPTFREAPNLSSHRAEEMLKSIIQSYEDKKAEDIYRVEELQHCLGNVIISRYPFSEKFTEEPSYDPDVIYLFDGYERLTYLLLILAALAPLLHNSKHPPFINVIDLILYRPENLPKIGIATEDPTPLLDIIVDASSGGERLQFERSSSSYKIYQNLHKYLASQFEDPYVNQFTLFDNDDLRGFVEFLLNDVVAIVIDVWSVKQALQIYDSLNSRTASANVVKVAKPKPAPRIKPRFPRADGLKHIFLSYAREDDEIMSEVKQIITGNGFKVWTDENLHPGTESWKMAIGNAIEDGEALIVLASPSSKRSEWVNREVSYAQMHKIHIYPLLIQGEPEDAVSFNLAEYQYADIRDSKQRQNGIVDVLKQIYNLHRSN